jgi:hypothetical protein
VLPDKFVAGGIIAKLPLSWKNFATSLKHKRQRFNVADLIGTLDVEERARAKERHGKGVQSSSANAVQKKKSNFNASHKKRKEKKRKRGQIIQPILRRKREENHKAVLFAGAWSIGRVNAQTANLNRRRNQ